MQNILILEDDPAVVEGISIALKNEHYNVFNSDDSESSFAILKKVSIDLIILDLMLPHDSGVDICRKLRNEGLKIPIIMLTAKKDELDKVLGLEIGADDYMTKPFSMRELLARMHALFRRADATIMEVDKFSTGDIYIDFKKLEATKNGKNLNLSALEFKILKYLIEHKGEVISREALLDNVWGYDNFPTTRTVDNFILSIRKQIENNPSMPKYLLTVHKAGYKFVQAD